MERTAVLSSNIKSVGYDQKSKKLEIEFMNGGIYEYDGVAKETYDDMINATSIGSFFYHNIKGQYLFNKK
jgi:hypothetical protein